MPRKPKTPEFVTRTYRTRDVESLPVSLIADIGAVVEFPTPGRETCDVGGPAHVHETLAGNGCRVVEPVAREGGSDSVAE